MPLSHLPVARLAAFYLAYYAALGAFTPYWSLYLKERGQDAAAISVLMSLWYATRIVAPGTWSWFAGRSPRPIRWLRLGAAATVISFCLFFLPLDFFGIAVVMCLFCFCYNAIMPQFESITLSHLGEHSAHYGRIRVWGSIGFILVVGAYGLVFDHISLRWLPLCMLPLFAAMLATTFFNDYGPSHAQTPGSDAGFRASLWRREVLVFFAVALLAQISFGPYYTFFSLYLDQHGYKPSALGGFWAVGVIVEIVMFFLSAQVFARFDANRVILVALLSAAARWLVTALFPDNVPVMTLAQLTHAINFAAFYAACMQLLARYFPGRINGHGQSVFYGFSSGVGGVLGALIAGLAWQIGGGRLAFLIGAGVSAIAAALVWWGLPRSAALTDSSISADMTIPQDT